MPGAVFLFLFSRKTPSPLPYPTQPRANLLLLVFLLLLLLMLSCFRDCFYNSRLEHLRSLRSRRTPREVLGEELRWSSLPRGPERTGAFRLLSLPPGNIGVCPQCVSNVSIAKKVTDETENERRIKITRHAKSIGRTQSPLKK